jgi:hypothetical protein
MVAASGPPYPVLPRLGLAITSAILFSFAIGMVEVDRQVQKTLRCCFVPQALIYGLLLALGNVVATILAALLVEKLDARLAPYYWLLEAFLGVFAFQMVLKNTNITFGNSGVLTIEQWTKKALTSATAAAIARDTHLNTIETGRLAACLAKVPIGPLNAFAAAKLTASAGANVVPTLDAKASANNADPMLYKAFAIAEVVPRNVILAFVKPFLKC